LIIKLPPTGFHGFISLAIASQISSKYKYIRLGVVWGSVMPDLDLLGSILIFIFTGGDADLTIAFHRTITHSIIVISVILLIAIVYQFFSENARIIYSPFLFGVVGGMLLHIGLDMFYFDGVTLLWPFQPMGERITIIPFTYEDLSPAFNSLTAKIIGTLDGYFELVFYLVFVLLANRYQTDQELNFHWKSKDIKITKWPMKLKYFSYFLVFQLLFFILLAFISIPWTFFDRNTFIIVLYIPLAPLYVITGFLPLFMRKTIYSLGTSN